MSTQNRKTDMVALRAAWEKEKAKDHYKYWKPQKNGTYLIRFLPPVDDESLFYRATAQHKVGSSYFFCPRVENKPCPICEKYRALWAEGTPASIALARELKPRKQYLYNIVVRETPEGKYAQPNQVQVYMSGSKVFDVVTNYFFDSQYGDLSDTEVGYDYQIIKEDGAGGFPSYDKSRPRKNPTPLADQVTIEKILGGLKDLNKEIELKSYDELLKVLLVEVGGRDADVTTSAEPKLASSADASAETEELNSFERELLNDLGK